MATYCFRCPTCGNTFETQDRDTAPVCQESHPLTVTVRDWRAEAVQVSPSVFVSREYTLPPPPPGLDD